MMKYSDWEIDLGRFAYEAYWQICGGKGVASGRDLPHFGELPEEQRAGWIEAANAGSRRV